MKTSRKIVRSGPAMTFAVAARSVLSAALVVAVGVSIPIPAAAAPEAGKGGGEPKTVGIESLSIADQARQRAQAELLELNNRVYNVASKFYDDQFAGAKLDVANNTLVVYWKGAVPSELSGLRAAQAAKDAARLRIEPADFSQKHLMKAASRVLPAGEGPGSVELATDGSGITVAAGDLPSAMRGVRAATSFESRLIQRIAEAQSAMGVPIAVAASRTGNLGFDVSRFADRSPYWAGAVMNRCTSGFSMYASGAPATRFTLTAAHCANYTDGVPMANGGGARMGFSDFIHEYYDHDDPAYDLGVVRLDANQSNQPYIYIADDSGQGGIPVVGFANGGIPRDGNYCVHGTTAINCNLQSGVVVRQCISWPPNGRCVYTVQMSSRDDITRTWCRGDSGGPIYYWPPSGGVMAAGVVSWSNHEQGDCSMTGGASVVATAVNLISGLRVVTTSAP